MAPQSDDSAWWCAELPEHHRQQLSCFLTYFLLDRFSRFFPVPTTYPPRVVPGIRLVGFYKSATQLLIAPKLGTSRSALRCAAAVGKLSATVLRYFNSAGSSDRARCEQAGGSGSWDSHIAPWRLYWSRGVDHRVERSRRQGPCGAFPDRAKSPAQRKGHPQPSVCDALGLSP
jgi:hypothetical protein